MRLMSLITKLENSIIVSLGTAHLNIDHEPAEKAFYNIREKIMKKKFRFQRLKLNRVANVPKWGVCAGESTAARRF